MALRPTRPENRSEQLAARDAAQQDVFLREVDDALRQDEMLGLFQRYGKPIIALVVLGLAAFGGVLFWNHWQAQKAGERGEQLIQALDNVGAGKLAEADKQLETLAASSSDGDSAAARMLRGGIALQQGRKDAALKLFAEVAADTGAPQAYRDLATIREVATRFDSMPPAEVVARLKPLAVPGNSWFGSAGEMLGVAYIKQNQTQLAGPLFAAIAKDKDVPDSLRNRARQLAGLLGVDAIDDVAKAAGAAQP